MEDSDQNEGQEPASSAEKAPEPRQEKPLQQPLLVGVTVEGTRQMPQNEAPDHWLGEGLGFKIDMEAIQWAGPPHGWPIAKEYGCGLCVPFYYLFHQCPLLHCTFYLISCERIIACLMSIRCCGCCSNCFVTRARKCDIGFCRLTCPKLPWCLCCCPALSDEDDAWWKNLHETKNHQHRLPTYFTLIMYLLAVQVFGLLIRSLIQQVLSSMVDAQDVASMSQAQDVASMSQTLITLLSLLFLICLLCKPVTPGAYGPCECLRGMWALLVRLLAWIWSVIHPPISWVVRTLLWPISTSIRFVVCWIRTEIWIVLLEDCGRHCLGTLPLKATEREDAVVGQAVSVKIEEIHQMLQGCCRTVDPPVDVFLRGGFFAPTVL